MKILSKITSVLLIFITILAFGQVTKEDLLDIEKAKFQKDSVYNANLDSGQITGSLIGQVLDEKGDPIKGALVTIDGTHWKSETDEHGNYKISSIKADTYAVTAADSGRVFQTLVDVNVGVGVTTTKNFKLITKECNEQDPEQKPQSIDLNAIETQKIDQVEDILKQSRKPIIYIYPEKETKINVKLDYQGTFTATYPKYPKYGWNLTAKPDGTLKDKNGKEYYSLFWEGVTDRTFTLDEGKVVKREDTAEFLENSLRTLGLNYKEANEFIIFWLPVLEKNPYNLIHFSTSEYEELAKLKITPKPETVIRVFMVFKAIDKPVEVKEQVLVSKQRKGFTVVEWGGTEVREGSKIEIK